MTRHLLFWSMLFAGLASAQLPAPSFDLVNTVNLRTDYTNTPVGVDLTATVTNAVAWCISAGGSSYPYSGCPQATTQSACPFSSAGPPECAASDRSAELWEGTQNVYLLYLTGPMGHRQESPYATNSIILDTTYPTAALSEPLGLTGWPQMLTTYPQFAVGSALASPVFATEPVDVNAAACHGAGSCDAPFYASGYISPVPNIWPWSNPDPITSDTYIQITATNAAGNKTVYNQRRLCRLLSASLPVERLLHGNCTPTTCPTLAGPTRPSHPCRATPPPTGNTSGFTGYADPAAAIGITI